MRLLNAHTRQIHEFISSYDVEDFAIVSHTWGKEEISLQDWQNLSPAELELREGYAKICHCCQQAIEDGYDWVWLDTCCIDKTSSSELSEAINSMFRWYQDASICYAYLADVADDTTEDSLLTALSHSRWFTRGWTLQELLAPKDIVFFSKNWKKLTTKLTSLETLSTVTGIEKIYLEGEPLEDASAAQKMSWAASRQTSRIEDIAYCLLGIFDVNMPLIYGEGKKAFKRLQEEIMKANPEDHTLFAWGTVVENLTDIPYLITDEAEASKLDDIPWDASKLTPALSGLLAESPADFKNSGGFRTSNIANKFYKHAPRGIITSLPQIQAQMIRIQLPVKYDLYQSTVYWDQPQIATLRLLSVAILLCYNEKTPGYLPAIFLRSCSERSSFNRTREFCDRYIKMPISVRPALFNHRNMLNIGPQRLIRIQSGDIMLRRYIWGKNTETIGWRSLSEGQTIPEGVIKMRGEKNGAICLLYNRNCVVSCRHAFGVKFERVEVNGEDGAGIAVSVIPMDNGPPEGTKFEPISPDFDIKWNTRGQCIRADILPGFRKVLAMPSDTVDFDILPFPVITFKAERLPLSGKGYAADAYVDVLDFVIEERMLPYYPNSGHENPDKKHR
ncbi:heterokaryon incompatibility protein-domain-containing protein [Xylaria bambusicola]|uniref:heterokaryon incompatibility protein-domain-containing protein n=1 Tax=Xylaria bambusicola TaxID=326684 RepID=UPI0020073268|nr:heterokaryon incompatibility protein-domain-containing protein [Xylaria bambusicola]KAI0514706.1 heterokaryon incompatibility protein-domain-containing protein [Xylaria bambusicola]